MKPWYKSMTKWGAILSAVAQIIAAPQSPNSWVAAIATFTTIWGVRNAIGSVTSPADTPLGQ